MSKRTQEDAGEERVKAKSKLMMYLVSRCSERTPDVLASTASESSGETRHESQLSVSFWTEQHQRTRRPVKDAYSSSHSELNAYKNWSSQEWKSDELMEVRTGRPVYEQPPGLFTEDTDTKSDHVPSRVTHIGSNAMLYVFEDNEAVIKMMIRGRFIRMWHVSRTHRVGRIVCSIESIWTPKSKSNMLTPKTNWLTF